jgi:hypothetical protein
MEAVADSWYVVSAFQHYHYLPLGQTHELRKQERISVGRE